MSKFRWQEKKRWGRFWNQDRDPKADLLISPEDVVRCQPFSARYTNEDRLAAMGIVVVELMEQVEKLTQQVEDLKKDNG